MVHELMLVLLYSMYRRTMHLVRVIKCKGEGEEHDKCPEGTTHICMRDNVSSVFAC